MTTLQEKLLRTYTPVTPQDSQHNSWIPKRTHIKDDFIAEIREIAPVADKPSSMRVEKVISETQILTQAKEDIFCQVETFLLEEFGQVGFDTRMEHFNESWNRLYEKYGELLIIALGELTDELSDEEAFVNFAGYINKDIVKNQIKSLKKRAAN